MNNIEFTNLLDQYKLGRLNVEQCVLLEQYIRDPQYSVLLDSYIRSGLDESTEYSLIPDENIRVRLEAKLNDMLLAEKTTVVKTGHVFAMRRWGWAAAIIVLLGTGTYLWNANKHNSPIADNVAQVAVVNEIHPGRDGAVLTLADGSQVLLDSLGDGLVAAQNGALVVLKDGQLSYNLAENTSAELVYNTMSTPKGRQFQMVLPDGTKVWLNAASSIKYPTVFGGKERRVDVTGEVYFEVAANSKKPFHVGVSNLLNVEVLGTHFNVNGYENETSIYTTLLEGSVKVNGRIIKPGQQAQLPTVGTSAGHQLS